MSDAFRRLSDSMHALAEEGGREQRMVRAMRIAEALLLQAIINQVMIDARKEHNPDSLPAAVEEVRNSAKQSGIDLDKFVLTQNGLEVQQ